MQVQPAHPTWSSRLTFLMAAVGAAVGLGNIWKFPYMAGANGGGAFVLVYLIAVLLVAIPILVGETLIGRRGRQSPPLAMRNLARAEGRSPWWGLVGWLGMLTAFLILSYYSVIAGWAVAYAFKAGAGGLTGITGETAPATFQAVLADPWRMTIWHGVFMALTVLIVIRGLNRGIERAVKVLMPALFVALLIMVGYSAVTGDFAAGFGFLFDFDFSKITGPVALEAVGQAFFSIGVAMALMMTYGSYLPRDISIPRMSFAIAAADTLVALLAGLAIFPLVFANGLDPAEGPGLIFVTFPLAIGNMPAGLLFGTIFFALLTVAALTSTIALMEPMVAWAVESRGITRQRAAILAGVTAWVLGIATVLSFNHWADFHPLGRIGRFAEATIFDLIDYLTANIMLPVGALLMALFVGWWVRPASSRDELAIDRPWAYEAWLWLMRIVAPLALIGIFVSNLT